ncbi:hypothetical protein Ddye_030682 [Dipteronia dyeriana]|uniref:Uncharacterized protein n=1 Tax=Dipteronia dyeriana TaxID=168575 RepID=A0AAD9TI32_9ROSI|nr:hypothetical protein Ddye_030682 [Dipteronia dyeriana]
MIGFGTTTFTDDCKYPSEYFRRQFHDALSRQGLSGLQKMTAAIRLLLYGYLADLCDEYLQIEKTTVVESMKHFSNVVIALYELQYMRAVASKDLWIWHSLFGMTGSHNDLNVLEHSPLFDNIIHDRQSPVNYEK